jgi:hypothetical protein
MNNMVVARFVNGRIVKGVTSDFFPAKDRFHVRLATVPPETKPEEIFTKDLKALFFVKDYSGDPKRPDKKEFDPAQHQAGRKIKVVFKDGEILFGTTQGYQPGRPGFFLVPADAASNIERCYVVSGSTQDISFI